jgi:hypothetical protein
MLAGQGMAAANAERVDTKPVAARSVAPATVLLANDGRALMTVNVVAKATPQVRATALELAQYLKRISGADFKIATSNGPLPSDAAGIAIGLAGDFAMPDKSLQTSDPTHNEDYLLRTHKTGVTLMGASDLAVENAVWDMLYRLGYRQFFPGEKWEIVPRTPTLKLAVNIREHPAYYSRRIWFGFGSLPENKEKYETWCRRNRAGAGITVNSGHVYQAIVDRHRAAFTAHPEYFALVGGKREDVRNAKFCISNPDLRQLVVDDTLHRLDLDPTLQSVSAEPSDGFGWCECPECAKMGSVTDRVVTLANQVAVAVEKKSPETFVCIYAYNEHSPPPSIQVHPRVIVGIATSFIRGGYTLDDLVAGWSKKANLLGIREYYGVSQWDRDLPGQAKGGNLHYLKTTIPHFNAQNARFMSAESSDNWGPNGLGYYIASRILWDSKEAGRVDQLVDDFLSKAFGPARDPMAEWYRLIDSSNKPFVSTDMIGRMYRLFERASQLATDEAVRGRINDLILYTRYVELYTTYTKATGVERQAAYEAVMRFTWRVRTTEMVHSIGIWRDVLKRDKQIVHPANALFDIPEPQNPWKSSAPYSAAEISQFVQSGIKNNPLLDFKAVAYSDELVPATSLKLQSGQPGSFDYTRGETAFYTWVQNPPATIPLQVRAGIVYNNQGNASLTLYPSAETLGNSVDEKFVAPDKKTHDLSLATKFQGMHRIDVSDKSTATALSWAAGTPMTLESSLVRPLRIFTRWSLYFYVPKGTKVIGGYGDGDAQLIDAENRIVQQLAVNKDYWSVPVPPGQDGKLWKINNAQGQFMLMTVPPYFARSGQELLLPEEVVKADSAN